MPDQVRKAGGGVGDLDALESMMDGSQRAREAPSDATRSPAAIVPAPPSNPSNSSKLARLPGAVKIHPIPSGITRVPSNNPSPRKGRSSSHDPASSQKAVKLLSTATVTESSELTPEAAEARKRLLSSTNSFRGLTKVVGRLQVKSTKQMSVSDLASLRQKPQQDQMQEDVKQPVLFYQFGGDGSFLSNDDRVHNHGVRHMEINTVLFGAELDKIVKESVANYEASGSSTHSSYDSAKDKELTTNLRSVKWFHLEGVNYKALHDLGRAYNLDPDVIEACKQVSSKPMVSWHSGRDKNGVPNSLYDHMLVIGHYIVQTSTPKGRSGKHSPDSDEETRREEEDVENVLSYKYEQVSCILLPDHNTMISVDGGMRSWEDMINLLHNQRNHVRQLRETPALLFAMLDTMIDEIFPLLDMYGDSLEGLEHLMMGSKEGPTHDHVRISYKIKRRIHSLRRYAWDARQLIQELRQNQYGIISKESQRLLTSVEKNVESMVEVAEAYIEQCMGIESYYESFQEKTVSSTLYLLTITSVTILPIQTLTGLFGMNFTWMPAIHGPLGDYGIVLFWGLVATMTCCVLGTMQRKGLLGQHKGLSWSSALSEKDAEEQDEEQQNVKRFRRTSAFA